MEKPELPKIELKLERPKFKLSELPTKIQSKLREYRRVLQITKKPTKEEFKMIVRASGLGILIVGVIGFIIHMIVQVIRMF